MDIITFASDSAVPRYSICSLMTKPPMYAQMRASFIAAGFDSAIAEYLCIDNSRDNQADAYVGINYFLAAAKGQYIIICHQDILLDYDQHPQLENCISELDRLDPAWALLGNAGGVTLGRIAMRITDPHGDNIHNWRLPVRVQALDENFILVRKAANLGVSRDLAGFHHYGLDICLLATIRGYSAYVVDFHLRHLSPGTRDAEFYRCKQQLTAKYSKAFAGRFLQTSCASMYVSGNPVLNMLLNTRFIIKWLRSFNKKRVRQPRI